MVLTDEQIIRKEIQLKERQLDDDPQAIYADTLREERVTNLLDQLNPDNLLTDIEHRIRGEKKDVYTKKWIPRTDNTKKISEELISNFISFLGAVLNQNVSMSNFSEREINGLMVVIISFVKNDLSVNDKKYGIEGDYTEMTRIANIICINCFATFKQALNGTLSRRIFGALKLDASLTKPDKNKLAENLAFWK